MARKTYAGGSSSLADFKQMCLLGEGAYSAVYKVLRLADNEIYALKKVKLPSLSDKEKQNALNEVRLLASVKNPYIIDYKEAFFDDKTRCLCIITEYADGGDLFQLISKCQKERSYIRETDVWRYLLSMSHGLKALHDMRILHRDMKCANVFLHLGPEGLVAKLGDFNVSKVAKRGLCMTQTGTPYYASPEVWRDMPYDAKSDLWSLGCVLYEMVSLRPPFRAEDMEGLYRKVLRGQYPRIPQHYSHDLSEVLAALLQVNPRHRPSIDQFLQMPVIRRHAADYFHHGDDPCPLDLLQTIKLPKNAIDLSICLPKPRYDLPKILPEEDFSPVHSSELGGRSVIRTRPTKRGPGSHQRAPAAPTPAMMPPVAVSGEAQQENANDRLAEQSDHGTELGVDRYAAPAPTEPEVSRPLEAGRDSLDAYLQQQIREEPAPPKQQPPQLPSGDTDKQEHSNNHYVRQDHVAESASRASPSPDPHRGLTSHGAGAGAGAGGGSAASRHSPSPIGQQPRHSRLSRRPMASYARAQYALGSQPQQQAPSQPTGGGLRLPRLFAAKAS